jgi:hypothetical protein
MRSGLHAGLVEVGAAAVAAVSVRRSPSSTIGEYTGRPLALPLRSAGADAVPAAVAVRAAVQEGEVGLDGHGRSREAGQLDDDGVPPIASIPRCE